MTDLSEVAMMTAVLSAVLNQTHDAGGTDRLSTCSPSEWDAVVRVAVKNAVIQRLGVALADWGVSASPLLDAMVRHDRRRTERQKVLIAEIAERFAARNLTVVFIKAFQHDPDMGHDIDVLGSDGSQEIENVLTRDFGAHPARGSLVSKAAGKGTWTLGADGTPVEVRVGRLGHFGEERFLASEIVRRRRQREIKSVLVNTSCPETTLALQVLQRMYGHRHFRLGDIVDGARWLSDPEMDWQYVTWLATRIGIASGLHLYEVCVCRILQDAAIEPLPDRCGRYRLGARSPSRLTFPKCSVHRVSLSAVSMLYMEKLLTAIRNGDWYGVARLSLVPALAVGTVGSRLLDRSLRHRVPDESPT